MGIIGWRLNFRKAIKIHMKRKKERSHEGYWRSLLQGDRRGDRWRGTVGQENSNENRIEALTIWKVVARLRYLYTTAFTGTVIFAPSTRDGARDQKECQERGYVSWRLRRQSPRVGCIGEMVGLYRVNHIDNWPWRNLGKKSEGTFIIRVGEGQRWSKPHAIVAPYPRDHAWRV